MCMGKSIFKSKYFIIIYEHISITNFTNNVLVMPTSIVSTQKQCEKFYSSMLKDVRLGWV